MTSTPDTIATAKSPALTADENRRMFDAIARRYDLLNRLMSLGLDRRWRERAVAALLRGEPAGPHILDIGCGTCDIILEIARQAKAARITGLDHSEVMLKAGREKLRGAGLEDRVRLQLGNALATGLPDQSFDGLITAFCFRNLTDRPAFLREARRILKPGAPLVILELTRPLSAPLRALHRLYNRGVVPLLGFLLSQGSAYRYLFRSIEAFPAQDAVTAMLRENGFADEHWTPFSGGAVTLFHGARRRS